MRTFVKCLVLIQSFLITLSLYGYQLPKQENLSPFWAEYFEEVDNCIAENFWGNLSIYKKTELYKDPYIVQMEAMGYNFSEDHEHPSSFYNSLSWVFNQMQKHIDEGRLTEDDVLWPGKAFAYTTDTGKTKYLFIPIGGSFPENAIPLNLLTPEVFVKMLSEGYFPMGNAIREHTNQTLAEHDLAHMAGFVSSPKYTRAVREAFRRVGQKMKTNPRVLNALQDFDTAYSLRLYYTIEVFTEVPKANFNELQKLIEIPLDIAITKDQVDTFLLEKAKNPAELYKYLAKIYWNFHHLVNPLGGESRDVLNRRRKFQRDGTLGSFYDQVSQLSSKFARNSIYSLFLNAKAALENKRSNHSDFLRSITEIHTPIIGALIGTSQLEIEDWVLECIEEVPNPKSKLYKYIHDSGLWGEEHLLRKAFCNPDYDKILSE